MRMAIHPGEILQTQFLDELGLTVTGLARSMCVPTARLVGILRRRRRVTADTAMKLAERLGTSPEYWMTLQVDYDRALIRQATAKTWPRAPLPPLR
jgi:antitoxin HigA-1